MPISFQSDGAGGGLSSNIPPPQYFCLWTGYSYIDLIIIRRKHSSDCISVHWSNHGSSRKSSSSEFAQVIIELYTDHRDPSNYLGNHRDPKVYSGNHLEIIEFTQVII